MTRWDWRGEQFKTWLNTRQNELDKPTTITRVDPETFPHGLRLVDELWVYSRGLIAVKHPHWSGNRYSVYARFRSRFQLIGTADDPEYSVQLMREWVGAMTETVSQN